MRIALALGNHIAAHGLGEVFAVKTGFLLARNPGTVRAPDIAFVSAERFAPHANDTGFLPLAPDLVVEVVSPHDRYSEVQEKIDAWLQAGTLVVLVADPRRQTMRRIDATGGTQTFRLGDTLTLPGLLPGWELAISAVFA